MRIAMINSSIQCELDRLREKHGFPGATCAYVLPDGNVGEAATGFADKETKEPMTPKSRMLAASIGKTFVATTILDLAHEGRLDLDDYISSWLGEKSWYRRLPNHATITIRHLLTHSAGLSDHVHTNPKEFLQLGSPKNLHFSPESLIEFILDQPPLFEAGKGWAYTDTGYILLGLVIEAASGRTYYEEVQERFLKPLKLDQTTPSDRPQLPGLISGYTTQDNPFGLPIKVVDASGVLVFNPAIEWTGGGLLSTSRDLALWAKLLFEDRAMEFSYLDVLLQSVPVSKELEKRYGAGVVIQTSPFGEKWGHLGVIPGYVSGMAYYPDYGIAIAFQVNTDENGSAIVSDMEESLAKTITSSF